MNYRYKKASFNTYRNTIKDRPIKTKNPEKIHITVSINLGWVLLLLLVGYVLLK